MSRGTCHKKFKYIYIYIFYQVVDLVGGWSVINGSTLSSLIEHHNDISYLLFNTRTLKKKQMKNRYPPLLPGISADHISIRWQKAKTLTLIVEYSLPLTLDFKILHTGDYSTAWSLWIIALAKKKSKKINFVFFFFLVVLVVVLLTLLSLWKLLFLRKCSCGCLCCCHLRRCCCCHYHYHHHHPF